MDFSGPVRFSLVGYGAWSRCHARAIQSTPGCELTAVCAATDASRRAAVADTGVAVFSSLPDLLAGATVDVIDIATPNHLHEEMACAAFAAGKHVLVEKTMATSVAACDSIIDAAKKSVRLLLVGHEMRFSGMYAEMHRLIDTGALGDVRYVLIDLCAAPTARVPKAGVWTRRASAIGRSKSRCTISISRTGTSNAPASRFLYSLVGIVPTPPLQPISILATTSPR
jgi:predicted dehydrogenase